MVAQPLALVESTNNVRWPAHCARATVPGQLGDLEGMQSRMALSPVFLVGICRGSQAIRTSPAQAFGGTPARMIFAANPASIAQIVNEIEEIWIVDFTHVWLVSPRIPGNLKMSDDLEMGANLLGQVATHDLTMVQVHLQQQIVAPDFLNNLMGVVGGIEKIPRHIARIDGLDHELHAVWEQCLSGPAQIADEYGLTARP